MFKQVKSAIFWTLVYKFRRRLSIVVVLLSIVLLSQWIYSDIVEYLQLIEKTQYLSFLLPIKWAVILFNIGLSSFLLLTIFKPSKEDKKTNFKEKSDNIKKEEKDNSDLSLREKAFLKRKIRSQSEILMDR